jgi:hypothetical protein
MSRVENVMADELFPVSAAPVAAKPSAPKRKAVKFVAPLLRRRMGA